MPNPSVIASQLETQPDEAATPAGGPGGHSPPPVPLPLVTSIGQLLKPARNDFALEELDVPEWGCRVLIRPYSGADRADMENFLNKRRPRDKRNRLIEGEEADITGYLEYAAAKVIVDRQGQRILGDKQYQTLINRNVGGTLRIVKFARQISGMTDDEPRAVAKNYESPPASNGTCDSHSGSGEPTGNNS